MSDETKVEQGENVEDNSVSKPIAKPNVVCSQVSGSKSLFDIWDDLTSGKSINYVSVSNPYFVEYSI